MKSYKNLAVLAALSSIELRFADITELRLYNSVNCNQPLGSGMYASISDALKSLGCLRGSQLEECSQFPKGCFS